VALGEALDRDHAREGCLIGALLHHLQQLVLEAQAVGVGDAEVALELQGGDPVLLLGEQKTSPGTRSPRGAWWPEEGIIIKSGV
jgi:hypothetical protein